MGEIIAQETGKKKGGKRRAKKHSTHIDMTPMVDLMCLLITFFMLTTAFSKSKVMEIVLPEKNPDSTKKQKSPEIPAHRTMNILLTEDDKIYWYMGIADPNKPPLPTVISSDFSKDGIRKVLLEKNMPLFKIIEEYKEKVKRGDLNPDNELQLLISELDREMQVDEAKKDILLKQKDKLLEIAHQKKKGEITENDYIELILRERIKTLKTEDKVGPIVLIKCDEKVKYKNFVDIIDEMAITNIARYAVVDLAPTEKEMLKNVSE